MNGKVYLILSSERDLAVVFLHESECADPSPVSCSRLFTLTEPPPPQIEKIDIVRPSPKKRAKQSAKSCQAAPEPVVTDNRFVMDSLPVSWEVKPAVSAAKAATTGPRFNDIVLEPSEYKVSLPNTLLNFKEIDFLKQIQRFLCGTAFLLVGS